MWGGVSNIFLAKCSNFLKDVLVSEHHQGYKAAEDTATSQERVKLQFVVFWYRFIFRDGCVAEIIFQRAGKGRSQLYAKLS